MKIKNKNKKVNLEKKIKKNTDCLYPKQLTVSIGELMHALSIIEQTDEQHWREFAH